MFVRSDLYLEELFLEVRDGRVEFGDVSVLPDVPCTFIGPRVLQILLVLDVLVVQLDQLVHVVGQLTLDARPHLVKLPHDQPPSHTRSVSGQGSLGPGSDTRSHQ